MSPDQRTRVPQEEISGEEATVERGATEAVGAEVETEVATVQTEVGVAMVETEVVVATEETEVGVAMEETEVVAATEETEVEAMEETEVAMEAKWEEETTTEMISATDHTDDCFECSFVSDKIHREIARVCLLLSSWPLLG